MPRTATRARVVLDLTGSKPTIESSKNVRWVDEVDSKALVVHFARPFPDALYRCDVIPSEPVKFQIKGRSKEGVGVVFSGRYPKKIKIVCEEI